MQRKILCGIRVIAQGRIPNRQRVHHGADTLAQVIWGLVRPMTIGGQLEAAERLEVEVEDVGLRAVVKAQIHRPILIGSVPRFVVLCRLRNVVGEEPAIVDIALELIGVRRAAPGLVARATKAHQGADAGAAFVAGDVIGVISKSGRAIGCHETGQAKPCAQINQHRLKATHIAVGRDHRPADRIGRCVSLGDRAVKQADAVMALKIGGVGQDQIGIGDHLGAIGIGIDDARDDIVACLRVFVGEHLDHAARAHRGIPRHIRHVEKQRVDLVGIARMGIGDDHMH